MFAVCVCVNVVFSLNFIGNLFEMQRGGEAGRQFVDENTRDISMHFSSTKNKIQFGKCKIF